MNGVSGYTFTPRQKNRIVERMVACWRGRSRGRREKAMLVRLRQGWLTLGLAVAAAIALSPARAAEAYRPDPKLLEAARKEREVLFYTPLIVDQIVRPLIKAFQSHVSGVEVKYVRADSLSLIVRMLNEARAGRVQSDVWSLLEGVLPLVQGGLAAEFEVPNAKGLPAALVDPNKHWLATNLAVRSAAYNTELVPKAQAPQSYRDLLDPRWKGKLLLPDVRTMGDAFWPMTAARLNLGDDIIKRLFVDQEPVLSRDTRQIAEFMVRGRFPVALGVNPLILKQFQRQGLGKSLKLFHFAEMDTQNSTSSTLWLVNRAPHPNAVRVLINWLLTREGQVHWAREAEVNSRRIGVEPGNPQFAVPRGAKLFQVDAEENLPEVIKTQDIARAVIK